MRSSSTDICKHGIILLFLLLPRTDAFSYVVVLKDGTVVEGKLIRETEEMIVLRDDSGMFRNFRKDTVDVLKTEAANQNGKKTIEPTSGKKQKTPHKPPRVITREYLESLRDKYDLGEGLFGEYSAVDFGNVEKNVASDDDLQFHSELRRSHLPVLVEFWAPWCGPCKKMEPVIREIALEFEHDLKLIKVNIDEQPAIAGRYGIQGIPTILVFQDGEVADRMVGLVPKQSLVQRIRTLLGLN